jgi:hypothetical protein
VSNTSGKGLRARALIRRAILRYSIYNRRIKAEQISNWMIDHDCRTVLFVGAIGKEFENDPNMANVGIVENNLISTFDVKIGINITPAKTEYPFVVADARSMPFVDDFVDFALSNAVIEHVGGDFDQIRMISEMSRVARHWVITTPNLWFPIESHTSTAFSHWRPSWRARHVEEFTRLLSRRQFRSMLPAGAKIEGHMWSPTFMAFYCKPNSHARFK